MATKLNNNHINTIMQKSKSYNILDVYISLSYISSEVKGKFIIQTYSNAKSDIVNLVKKHTKLCYRTIHNNIIELIELGILEYRDDLSAWILNNMESMVVSGGSGYVNIREFFLSNTFHKMSYAEKRCIVYLAQLCDSTASFAYDDFVMNLSKPGSKWLSVLKTKSKYYARKIILDMLKKYKDIFINTSSELRQKDIAPKSISNFKFRFSCTSITNIDNDNSQYELVKLLNPKEFSLVKDKIKLSNITLSKQKIMHIVRAISNIKQWFLKERIAQVILNKYIAIQVHKSREDIKSLPAYLVAVVKIVMEEYTEFLTHLKNGQNGLLPNMEDSITESNINSIIRAI